MPRRPGTATIQVLVPIGHPTVDDWRELYRDDEVVLLPLNQYSISHYDLIENNRQHLPHPNGITVDDVREQLLHNQQTDTLVLWHLPSGRFTELSGSAFPIAAAVRQFARMLYLWGIVVVSQSIKLCTMDKSAAESLLQPWRQLGDLATYSFVTSD